ncbi:hypothetical protein JW916_01375 [Candidatus Sumerlaeota bacterium]|nr:hypothetical protein [Candidatus Sumerlaeota bacterium]
MLALTAPRAQASWEPLFEDDFSSNPLTSAQWTLKRLNSIDDTPASPALFSWSAPEHCLNARWDSSNQSSLYAVPLGRTLTESDSFSFSFDLVLSSVSNPNDDFFQIAVGMDDSTATRTRAFNRQGATFGDPADTRRCVNIADWSYVPPNTWGHRVFPTICPQPGDTFRNNYLFTGNTELRTAHTYRVEQTYDGVRREFSLKMTDDGTTMTTEDVTTTVSLYPADTFAVDRFAVKSYYDEWSLGGWRVEGTIDNIVVTIHGETVVNEDFSTDPSARWVCAGLRDYNPPDASLVAYHASEGRVAFTWDAARSCTALSHALATDLTDASRFAFEFDLELTEIDVNGDFFQIALGMHNGALHNFDRGGPPWSDPGSPISASDVVDWAYYPEYDFGFGPESCVMSTIVVEPGVGYGDFLNHQTLASPKTALSTGVVYRVRQEYDPYSREFTQTMTADGSPVSNADATYTIVVPEDKHFRVNRFGPVSYHNTYAWVPGAWRVRGTIDNVRLETFAASAREAWRLYE